MLRYHKEVYFSNELKEKLKAFTDNLNKKAWRYSQHALENIKYRTIDIENLLIYIKGLNLSDNDIFEAYIDDDIVKACYRIKYNLNDVILVIGKNKELITIYLNAVNDKHDTLKKELYNRQ